MKNTLFIAVLASLSLATSAFGAISLTFEYDITTGDTVASYSGAWDSFNAVTQSLLTYAGIDSANFYNVNGWFVNTSDTFSGSTFAWNEADPTSVAGDPIIFATNRISGVAGYVQGQAINGSLTFASTSLADLGLTDGQNATYTSFNGGNSVIFNAVQVPEPATNAALLGLGILGLALWWRRR